jgi:hypothetical protein
MPLCKNCHTVDATHVILSRLLPPGPEEVCLATDAPRFPAPPDFRTRTDPPPPYLCRPCAETRVRQRPGMSGPASLTVIADQARED